MKRTLFLLVLSCSLCHAQTGLVSVYMKSGEVISATHARLIKPRGYSPAAISINSNENKSTILIDSVDHVEVVNRYGNLRTFGPMAIQSSLVWAERTFESDRITIYYIKSQSRNILSVPSSWKYYGYTIDDGPLKGVSGRNVMQDVGNDPAAMVYIKKAKITNGFQNALAWAGVATVTVARLGLLTPNNNTNVSNYWTPYAAVIGAYAVSAILQSPKQRNLLNALKAFEGGALTTTPAVSKK